jgi:alkanesulfonate monooxygenase SsuD/methylene tetrahydromethanopterin reductase-like flavin-dependent oxidoreductase (luciferase family)
VGGLRDAGFEGLFFSEHHFAFRSLSPSPNSAGGRHGGAHAPPAPGHDGQRGAVLRAMAPAEEYAMLDQLSGGRLEIASRAKPGRAEFRAVGMKERSARSPRRWTSSTRR